MSTIVISGYYGAGNAGDEAILAAMLQELRRRAPETEIVVVSRNPAQTRSMYGVRAIGRFSWAGIWRLLGQADLLISGGGGLLQDVYPRRRLPSSILYYLGLCVLAKLRGCRVMFYAQGIGPLRRRASRFCVRLVADRLDLITVRDPESASLLAAIGVSRPPVRVTADPVLAWAPTPAGAIEADTILSGGAPILVLALRPWCNDELPFLTLARVADRAVSQWGLRPVFVPFAPGGDGQVAAKVRAAMQEGREASVLPNLRPTEIYAVMSRAELVLGMRLHALVFAALAGVPPVGLAYDPKVANFLRRLGLDGLVCPLGADEESIWRAMAITRSDRVEIRSRLRQSVADLAELARFNALLALQLAVRSTVASVEKGKRPG